LDIHLSNVTFTDDANHVTGILVIAASGANRAKLELRNPDSTKKVTLETAEIRGQKITDFGRVDAEAVDPENGHREMTLNFLAVDNLDHAQGIADFELMRRKTPSGKVQAISLHSQGKLGGNQHDQQLARTIGDRIKIIESQTGHTGEYFIIGEEHRL